MPRWSYVADIRISDDPPVLRSENARLSGQFGFLKRATAKLKVAVPFTLLITYY